MSVDRSLTRYRQTSTLASGHWSTPPIELEAPVPRASATTTPAALVTPLRTDNLFANLLFNREQVYSNQSAPIKEAIPAADAASLKLQTLLGVTIQGNSPELRQDNMAPKLRPRPKFIPATTVGKRSGRLIKNSTESKEKVEEHKCRKRPAAKIEGAIDERPAKATKTDSKANIGKKVDSNGGNSTENTSTRGTLTLSKPPGHKIIVLSDNDTDPEPVTQQPERESSEMLRVLKSKSQPQTKKGPVAGTFSRSDVPGAWQRPKAGTPTSVSDTIPALVVARVIKQKMVEEGLRRELQATNATIKQLLWEKGRKHVDTQFENFKREQKHKQGLATLNRDFEVERHVARTIAAERNDLRNRLHEFMTTKQREEAISAKDAKHQQELQVLQARNDQEVEARKQDQKRHEDILSGILKTRSPKLSPCISELEIANTQLTKELDQFKTAAKPTRVRQDDKKMSNFSRTQSTLFPVPSQFSSTSDGETREDNVRKMYIKTKRQYDILHSVAQDLVTCTRSMDLGNFGEFGSYMKKLRRSLDGDGAGYEGGRTVMVRKKKKEG